MSGVEIKKNKTAPDAETSWGVLELESNPNPQVEVLSQLPNHPEFLVDSVQVGTSKISPSVLNTLPGFERFFSVSPLILPPPIDNPRKAAAQRLQNAVQDRIQMYAELGRPVGITDRVMNLLTVPLWLASPYYQPLKNQDDFVRLKKGYEAVLHLVGEDQIEEAFLLFMALETDPKVPEMLGNAEFAEGFVKYGVNVGLVLAAGFTSGAAAGALGLSETGVASLLVRSTSFVGTHRVLGEVITGQPMLYDRSATVQENSFYLAEEIMLTAGMLRFIGMSGRAYAEFLKTKFGDLSPLTMTAMTEGLIYTGAFATEYGAFTGWEMVTQLYQMAKQQDFDLENFLNHTLSPEAMEERLLFLAALKVGGGMAKAWAKPMIDTRQLSEVVLGRVQASIETLQIHESRLQPAWDGPAGSLETRIWAQSIFSEINNPNGGGRNTEAPTWRLHDTVVRKGQFILHYQIGEIDKVIPFEFDIKRKFISQKIAGTGLWFEASLEDQSYILRYQLDGNDPSPAGGIVLNGVNIKPGQDIPAKGYQEFQVHSPSGKEIGKVFFAEPGVTGRYSDRHLLDRVKLLHSKIGILYSTGSIETPVYESFNALIQEVQSEILHRRYNQFETFPFEQLAKGSLSLDGLEKQVTEMAKKKLEETFVATRESLVELIESTGDENLISMYDRFLSIPDTDSVGLGKKTRDETLMSLYDRSLAIPNSQSGKDPWAQWQAFAYLWGEVFSVMAKQALRKTGDFSEGTEDKFLFEMRWIGHRLLNTGLLNEGISPAVVRGMIEQSASYYAEFPEFREWHLGMMQPIFSRHMLLGALPTADSYLNGMTSDLAGFRRLFGPDAGHMFFHAAILRGNLNSEFKLVIEKGRHEYATGVELAFHDSRVQSEPWEDPEPPLARVGIRFGANNTLQIVNIQGGKKHQRERQEELQKYLGETNPLNMLVALAIIWGRSQGFDAVEGVRDAAQHARRDMNRSLGNEDANFYDLFFRRFGFEPPEENGDFWRLDLQTLSIRRKNGNNAANTPGEYLREVLTREDRGRPKQWDRHVPGHLEGPVKAFWKNLVPTFRNASWEPRRSDDGEPICSELETTPLKFRTLLPSSREQ